MGIASRLAGVHRGDELTLRDARGAQSQGLREFTVTVHSTYGGLALLPRLTPNVVQELQAHFFGVTKVTTDDWSYNSHITCRVA